MTEQFPHLPVEHSTVYFRQWFTSGHHHTYVRIAIGTQLQDGLEIKMVLVYVKCNYLRRYLRKNVNRNKNYILGPGIEPGTSAV